MKITTMLDALIKATRVTWAMNITHPAWVRRIRQLHAFRRGIISRWGQMEEINTDLLEACEELTQAAYDILEDPDLNGDHAQRLDNAVTKGSAAITKAKGKQP